MKKTLLSIAFTAIMVSSFGQITIDKKVDEMTDKISYSVDGLLCTNQEETKGFGIYPNITVKNDSKEIKDLIIQMAGLGSCNKNNTMIILFENGSKITLKSWNDFDCKGVAYFSISSSYIQKLSINKVSKIRLTNGDSYKNYTHILEGSEPTYFIELFQALHS